MKFTFAPLLLALAGVTLAPLSAAQETLYVNPAGGSDANSGLNPQLPLKTIAQAVAVAPAGSEILLQNGVYDPSNQSLPILVNKPLTIRGANARGARVLAEFEFFDVFQVVAPNVVFEDFEIASGLYGIRVDAGDPGPTAATIRDMHLRGFGGVRFSNPTFTGTEQLGSTLIEGCLFECSAAAIGGDFFPGPSATLDLRATTFRGIGAATGLQLRTFSGAGLNLTLSGVVFANLFSGLQLNSLPGSSLDIDIRNSTFTAIQGSGVLTGSGIKEINSLGDRSISVRDSIFWNNQTDLVDYDPATYLVSNCIVQQPALIGVGGSFSADPLFARATEFDVHLTHASPAIDAGAGPAGSSLDLDGDPRGVDCSSGLPDIGADEYVQDYLWFPAPPTIATANRMRLAGLPGELFVIAYSGNGGAGGLCSYALPATFTFAPNGAGVIAGDGVGERDILFPADPALIGLDVGWGGAVGNATEIRLLNNLFSSAIGG